MKNQLNAKVTLPTLGETVLTTGQDIRRDSNVPCNIHIGCNERGYYWFEMYSLDERYHAEGMLDINDGKLEDYDGVGELPNIIMDILMDEWSVDCHECGHEPTEIDYTLFQYKVLDKVFDCGREAMDYLSTLDLDGESRRAIMKSILNP